MTDDRLPAYVSNGLVALRVPALPWTGSFAVINGLAGVHPVASVECVPQAPYPLAGDVRLNGVWLSDAREQARAIEQIYDFSCGELTSRFRFTVDGVTATITVLTFASRTEPTVVVQENTLEVDAAAGIELRAAVSPSELPGSITSRSQGVPDDDSQVVDGSLRWKPAGDYSTAGIAYSSQFDGTFNVERTLSGQRIGPLCTTYQFSAQPGRRYRMRQYASLVPERVHHDPDRQATRLLALAVKEGFDRLRTENREEWNDLWKGRPVIIGADSKWQALVDAAFFYLHSSVHGSSLASTNIFGLGQWGDYHYYYGHVMWDIEMFVVPTLLLTEPDAARALLDYRTRGLDAARRNAQMWGYRGAQFPWESSPLHAEEASPQIGSAAMYEHHVSMDVAHAFAQYFHATGDERFLEDQAWPLQAEVAEWIVSRVERTPRGFEIREAMGIAERTDPSDNVAFVNMAACVALDDAMATARRLGRAIPRRWEHVRDGLVLPMRGNVILDHDGYEPSVEKGSTPAPLCGLFPLDYRVSNDVYEATTRFYLDLADDYIGSPMLSPLYGAWAAHVGERELSAKLFEEGYARFVNPRFMNTHEYRDDKFPEQPMAGPFTANIGGFLTALLYGLTRVRISEADPSEWAMEPVVMPEGWDGIEIERLWVRGRATSLVAKHGQVTSLESDSS
jgi:trehalose/maltose hydrolase-like predicted phosphorylase